LHQIAPHTLDASTSYLSCLSVRSNVCPLNYRLLLCLLHYHAAYQDLRDIARACCKAAQILHNAGIVHRDLRKENIVCLAPAHWMVIDLEHAAKADQIVQSDYRLVAWDDNTLDVQGQQLLYTRGSDMYLIGCLLAKVGANSMSHQAQQFVNRLKAKSLSAADALGDPWLQ
jgi:Protein kinase domain